MSLELDVLKYVGIYEEPAGSHGTDHSGTPGDFLPFPFKEGALALDGDRGLLRPNLGKQRADGHDLAVLGARRCQGSIGTTLHSHGLDLDGDVAVPTTSNWGLARLLKTILGGLDNETIPGAQTVVVASGTSTTTVEVTTGHGARWTPGTSIGAEIVAGTIEAREVASVAGDIVTVKEAFSGTPITGTPVRRGVTFHLTEDPDTSLQFHIQGRELNDHYVFAGLQATQLALAVKYLDVCDLTATLMGTYYSQLAAHSGITIPTYSVSPGWVRAVAAPLTVPTVGSTTRTLVDASTFQLSLQIAYEQLQSGGRTEGVLRARRQAKRPVVSGAFEVPLEDTSWEDAFANRTARAVFQQLGNLPGETWLISIPTVQIGRPVRKGVQGGLSGYSIPFEGRHDAAIGSTSELSYSALRFHCL